MIFGRRPSGATDAELISVYIESRVEENHFESELEHERIENGPEAEHWSFEWRENYRTRIEGIEERLGAVRERMADIIDDLRARKYRLNFEYEDDPLTGAPINKDRTHLYTIQKGRRRSDLIAIESVARRRFPPTETGLIQWRE